MLEVSLYAITPGEKEVKVGRCVSRNRFDKEAMGVSTEEFVKGFLKDSIEKFSQDGRDINSILESTQFLGRMDLECVNNLLVNIGYMFQICTVADDEENATGVPSGEVIEWNIINRNHLQDDYPTATKIVPTASQDIPTVLHQIIEQVGLYNEDKFAGVKNPFTPLLDNMDRIKNTTGEVSSAIVTRIYKMLADHNIDIFCATSED